MMLVTSSVTCAMIWSNNGRKNLWMVLRLLQIKSSKCTKWSHLVAMPSWKWSILLHLLRFEDFLSVFIIHFFSGRSCIYSEATEKELEKYLEFIWWWKDFIFPCPRIRSSSLQTYSLVCYGRDRCSSWYVTFFLMKYLLFFNLRYKKRINCGSLYQGSNKKCSVYHYFIAKSNVWPCFEACRDLQDW